MPGLGQVTQHSGHHSPVSAVGKPLFDRCRRKPLDPQQRLGRAQPLADPLHETLAAPSCSRQRLAALASDG